MPENERIISRVVFEVNGLTKNISRKMFHARPNVGWYFLLALVCGTMFSCSDEHKAGRLYETAKEHVREGELEQAVEVYGTILRDYPEEEVAALARDEIELYRGLAKAERMYPVRELRTTIVKTARALERYRGRNRRWPSTLYELTPGLLPEYPADPWGRALLYQRKSNGRGYLLATLGADGETGGTGEHSDVFVEDGEFVRRPSMTWP